jgi:hypothetical protein
MGNRLRWKLQEDLDSVRGFIQKPDWVSLGVEDRRELQKAADRFQERLDAAQDQFLWAGFLGGTGVGKSSLMNVLAKAQVAGASHRRPHTDRILIYHHQLVELPSFVHQCRAAWAAHGHQSDAVKDILLCDLPDFDSLQPENREAVLEFMSHLDILVWVASPEKYADRSLHTTLVQAPKAVGNFYFVLNKMDWLWDGDRAEASLDQMQRVTEHFRNLIIQTLSKRPNDHAGGYPSLFAVSALERPPYSSWNQIALFRDALFTQRSAKQVRAIKSANLEQEMDSLYQPLRRERDSLQKSLAVVERLQEEMTQEVRTWHDNGERILASWVRDRMEPLLIKQGPLKGPLFGPARLVRIAVLEWRRRGEGDPHPVPDVSQELEIQKLHSRIENLKNRLVAVTLREDQAQSLRRELEDTVDVPGIWEQMTTNWQGIVTRALTLNRPAKGLKLAVGQGLVYGLLTLFFAFGLGGRQAWMDLLVQPGPGTALAVFFSLLESLFSPLGLAALGSYGLLMLWAGVRFYQAQGRRLEKWARARGRRISAELTAVWDEGLEEVDQSLRSIHTRMEDKLRSLQSILEPKG